MTNKKEKRKIQIEDLRRTRKIVTSIIKHLDNEIINPVIIKKSLHESEELKEQLHLLIGEKGDITSAIAKLTNLLIKIIPLEQKTCEGFDGEELEEESRKILGEDMDIIKRFMYKTIRACGKKL
jgi:hypothetical protein